MTLDIATSKNGKPHILFKNYKYRLSHDLKSGEAVWRCLGSTCKASLKTDSEKTHIISSNTRHSGHHAATMRTVMSPRVVRTSTPTPAPVAESDYNRGATLLGGLPSSSHRSAETLTVEAHAETAMPSPTYEMAPIDSAELVSENNRLREDMAQLSERYKCVLDHSIESDQRLLEYTDQVFVTTTPLHAPVTGRVTPCTLPPVVCQDQRCVMTRDLVASLRTTIEVLEVEVLNLKSELAAQAPKAKEVHAASLERTHEHKADINNRRADGWTTVKNKRPSKAYLTNSFQCFQKQSYKVNEICNNKQKNTTTSKNLKPTTSSRHNGKHLNQITAALGEQNKTSTLFSRVQVVGDSHGRHLAGLLRERLDRRTSVTGLIKPGAGLLNVTSNSPPPPRSCTVLLAGTNDVAAGKASTIFQYLEQRVAAYINPTSSVLLATLPYRHDLRPNDPVHYDTAVVNNYLEEICARQERVHLLDVNTIQRKYFSKHGMHLRMSGKRQLAEMVIRCLRSSCCPAPENLEKKDQPTAIAQPATRSPGPRILPYSNFAEAVKQRPSRTTSADPSPQIPLPMSKRQNQQLFKQTKNDSFFLEIPLTSVGIN